jgi:hypothetical protein
MTNITSITCIAVIAFVTVSCDTSGVSTRTKSSQTEIQGNFEIWSSAPEPIAHTGHAIAFDWESYEYLYWIASDVMREPYENYPKRGTFLTDESGRIVLDTILGSEVTLRRIDVDGSEALSVVGSDFDQALRAGLVLFNRKHGRVESPWSLAELTEFEKIRTAEILKVKAEQAGTGPSATRPESKSEDGDKPQPEAEARSR